MYRRYYVEVHERGNLIEEFGPYLKGDALDKFDELTQHYTLVAGKVIGAYVVDEFNFIIQLMSE